MTIFLAVVCAGLLIRRPRLDPRPVPLRLVLIVILIEIRSGRSVLASLQAASARLPEHADLARAARLASVAGLSASVAVAPRDLRPLLAQLARAQRSGASLAGTVRRLIDDDLAEERTERLARARSLPARLMIPVTLLMLPGVVLLVYAPSLIAVFEDLVGGLP
ncbi:MAG TPA: type II secretion system F family protein [Acidimicrobiia bacterium]